MDSFQAETLWTWIRRAAGIALLTFIVVAESQVDTWVFVLIAGLLGLWDIIRLQDVINALAVRNGKKR